MLTVFHILIIRTVTWKRLRCNVTRILHFRGAYTENHVCNLQSNGKGKHYVALSTSSENAAYKRV